LKIWKRKERSEKQSSKWFLKIMRMITPYRRLSGQIKQTGITLESWVKEKTVNVEANNKN
jgi:hypothetical protein